MKKILLAITLLFALPVLASAEENVSPHQKPCLKSIICEIPILRQRSWEQVQKQEQEQEQEQASAPEHTMKNN